MRKIYLFLCVPYIIICGIVLLLGCGEQRSGTPYSFVLSVTNNSSYKLFISAVANERVDIGSIDPARTINFKTVEVYVPADDPNPKCTLMAVLDQYPDSIYARQDVYLKGLTDYSWTID